MANHGAESHGNHLLYACDAGRLSCAHPPNTPLTLRSHQVEDCLTPAASSSETKVSSGESNRWTELLPSLRVFSEALLRMEVAEVEMFKSGEAWRVESERRRVELETAMTQMLTNTQLQIASFISQRKKRKRVELEDEDSSLSGREREVMLGLLQCNLNFL